MTILNSVDTSLEIHSPGAKKIDAVGCIQHFAKLWKNLDTVTKFVLNSIDTEPVAYGDMRLIAAIVTVTTTVIETTQE